MENQTYMTLYQREECPYCQLVRRKLTTLQLPVIMVPVEERGEEREELIEISGQRAVPVLVDGDRVVTESSVILEYLDKRQGRETAESMSAIDYGLRIKIRGTFAESVERSVAALKKEGFGVLTEIDVKKTLREKIGVEVPEQIILGACNPNFAHQAMGMEPDLGLLLPCNVTVRSVGNGECLVTAVNPVKLLALVGRGDLLPVAVEVRKKMEAVLDRLSG